MRSEKPIVSSIVFARKPQKSDTMNSTKIFSILTWLLLFSTLNAFASKEIDLSYKLQKGKKYNLDINNRQTIAMNMMGQSMNLNQNIVINQSVVIDEIDEIKNTTLKLTYNRIQFKQNAMGMEVQWDSDKPDPTDFMAKQIAGTLGKAIGTTITAIIDSKGNPISNNKTEVINQNSNISGFESGMMVVYSDKKVKEGDTWQMSLKPDPQSDYTISSEYKLDEIKGKTALISFSGVINGSQIMGEKATIKGVIKGKAHVEIATGWTIWASINQDLEMEMMQDGAAIPMKMSSFIEMNSKEN